MTVDRYYQDKAEASIIRGKATAQEVKDKFDLKAPKRVKIVTIINGIPCKVVNGKFIPLKRV